MPKKNQTNKILYFRSITLVTSLYKIIAKVLPGHLCIVLHEIINISQGASVKGKQILDDIMIAHDMVDEKRRSR